MTFELTNNQRDFFGLEPIERHWTKVPLKGDSYRPESILYFDGEIIKRHILSTENRYFEKQYDEPTKERIILLPKTNKGKEKKLSASVLEQRHPTGAYLSVSDGNLTIGNYNTDTTFYSSNWDNENDSTKSVADLVVDFIKNSPEGHLQEINLYKNAARKNVKFRSGDYFCFKLDRINFGFGRLLLDVNKVRKKKLIKAEHGLGLLMGPPLIVQLFAYKSPTRDVNIPLLDSQPKLPADVMMDNLLLYGEYEIIGHKDLKDEEFEFPISYGRSIDQRRMVFLQWGLIHLELPVAKFYKYVTGENKSDQNPYGYYSIGFRPHYDTGDIHRAIENNGVHDFSQSKHYNARWDLRNPENKEVKEELFKAFGLDPSKTYLENCKLTNTILPVELLRQL
jgi:hypothetical protein